MQYYFELYILSDQLLPEHWTKLYKVLASYLGTLGKFEVTFRCSEEEYKVLKDQVMRWVLTA